MLLAGVARTQFDARRLRLFALEVFFLGTAILNHLVRVPERGLGGPERGLLGSTTIAASNPASDSG
jgi:hypothetical protein